MFGSADNARAVICPYILYISPAIYNGFATVQEILARLRWRKTQPPKSPLSGGLVTQFPPDKEARGGRNDECWIFAQSLKPHFRGIPLSKPDHHFQLSMINLPSIVRRRVFTWMDRIDKMVGAAEETMQEILARLRWRKTQPSKSPLSGGLVTQFPPDKGARGVRNDECWIFA